MGCSLPPSSLSPQLSPVLLSSSTYRLPALYCPPCHTPLASSLSPRHAVRARAAPTYSRLPLSSPLSITYSTSPFTYPDGRVLIDRLSLHTELFFTQLPPVHDPSSPTLFAFLIMSISVAAQRVFAQLDAQGKPKVSPVSVSLHRHYQTASTLLSQARTYQREGEVERSYILYRRFVAYLLTVIHKHPQYRSPAFSKDKVEYQQLADKAMTALEELRADIALKYADPDEEEEDEMPISQPQQPQYPQYAPSYQREERKEAADPPLPPLPSPPSGAVAQEGAAIDAALEARMAALVLSSDPDMGEEERKQDGPVSADLPSTYRSPSPPPQSLIATAFTLSTGPEPTAPTLDDRPSSMSVDGLASAASPSSELQSSSMPGRSPADVRGKWANLRMPAGPPVAVAGVPRVAATAGQSPLPSSLASVRPSPPLPSPSPLRPSPLPYSSPLPSLPMPHLSMPPPPGAGLRAAGLPSVPAPQPVPPPTRTRRPPVSSFTSTALRPLHLPTSLMATFMQYAHSNTMQNVETCAVLAGQLMQGRLVITHCILPAQRGSASTCSTIDELDLLAVQSRLDLLTLGWIHTHPTQSCFLSSVDLHTQYGYQCMMAEAIAVVMAPTVREQGVYSISPQGMDVLSSCDRSGFHEHDTSRGVLYGQAMHVVREDKAPVQFIDLRKPEPGSASGPSRAAMQPQPRPNESALYPGLRPTRSY